jgi:hypothetical protein
MRVLGDKTLSTLMPRPGKVLQLRSDPVMTRVERALDGMGNPMPSAETDEMERYDSTCYDDEGVYDDFAEAWDARLHVRETHHARSGPQAHRATDDVPPPVSVAGQPLYPNARVSAVPPPPTNAARLAPTAPAVRAPKVESRAATFNAAKTVELAAQLTGRTHAFKGRKIHAAAAPSASVDALVAAFDHMMATLDTDRYRGRYGYAPHEGDARALFFKGDVPAYFANVGGQSIFWRKVLSIAGLRNLVHYGPLVFQQMQDTLFRGDGNSYRGDVGVNLMRRVTGNVVDLDTTVLRCNDPPTLAAINASNRHKGLAPFGSSGAFSSSTQADEIAVNCATQAIDDFAALFSLTDADCRARLIHPSQMKLPIPTATDNSTRGHTPVWHYMNAGQDSFHANVPPLDDVVGALLKAPFACAEHYAAIHATFSGAELTAKLDRFFEECVVDSCFNMKWKAIEEFGASLRHEGTIVDVLQRLQMAHQDVFTEAFFDADNEQQDAEAAAMARVAVGRMGRDKTGAVRAITAADAAEWVRDPSVAI